MRFNLSLLALFVSVVPMAADTFLYVSMAPEQKIQVFRLDPKDGKLTPVETVAVEGAPGSLAVDPSKKFLVASLRSNSALVSFEIDSATGKLKPRSTTSLMKGANAAYVAVDRSGQRVVSASYSAGKVVVHDFKDGMLSKEPLQTITTAMTAHCVAFDRENQYAFVPHVSPNAVFQFRFDASKGMLSDLVKVPGGAEKAGPRHLAFHPTADLAYTSDETGSSITSYRFDAKTGLKPVMTLTTLPSDFKGSNTTAEVKVHPNGKFAWVSNRGHESLAGFRLELDTGKVIANGHTPTEKTPRSFEVDPDGKYVFGAGEGSGKLAVFSFEEATGKLTRIHTVEVGKSLTWVMAVKFGGK